MTKVPFKSIRNAALIASCAAMLAVPVAAPAFAAPAAPGSIARPESNLDQVAWRARHGYRRGGGGRDAALVGAAAVGVLGAMIAAGAAQERYYEEPRPYYGAYGRPVYDPDRRIDLPPGAPAYYRGGGYYADPGYRDGYYSPPRGWRGGYVERPRSYGGYVEVPVDPRYGDHPRRKRYPKIDAARNR